MKPFGLTIRPMISALVDAFVPFETHPVQVLDNGALGFLRRPLRVGVFDPQDEGAALASRQQPVEEGGARVADVQLPGGTGRETNSHRLRTSAIACAAMASPRPRASTPSFVFPLTLTRSR